MKSIGKCHSTSTGQFLVWRFPISAFYGHGAVGADTGVREKNTHREKKMHGNMSFQSTKSGAGWWFSLWDCRARACAKGMFFSQTPVGHAGRAQRDIEDEDRLVALPCPCIASVLPGAAFIPAPHSCQPNNTSMNNTPLIGILRAPLFKGPLIRSLYVLTLPYLANFLYK